MKRDPEVLRMLRERAKGRTQEQAAARAGMSVRTAGTYERGGRLPSQLAQPRRYRTRPNPFAADWPWITGQLERDAALQATTLFALLCDQYPGRYQAVQLRTLQRQIATWRAQYGPGQEVIFAQIHVRASMRSPTSRTWPRLGSRWVGCRSRTCSSTWCSATPMWKRSRSASRRASNHWSKGSSAASGSSEASPSATAPII